MPVPADEAAPPAITNHNAHPGHTLLERVADDDDEFFICGGCKEPYTGGARYRCEHDKEGCNFAMHACCAVAADRLTYSEFGVDRVFLFLQEPEPPRAGTAGARSCAACGEDVRGFVYHCFQDDIDLHPSCALALDDAVVRDDDGRVAALDKEAALTAWQPRETCDDDNDQSRKVHRILPVARHRRQAGKRDPPPAENTQPMNNNSVSLEVRRQEVSRPGGAPGDRNRGRGGAPVSRYRWGTWKR